MPTFKPESASSDSLYASCAFRLLIYLDGIFVSQLHNWADVRLV